MQPHNNELGQLIGQPLDNWQPCQAPSRAPMLGNYCRLEALSMQHAEQLYASLCQQGELANWTYLPYGPFDCREDFYLWLEQQAASDDPLFFTVIDLASNLAVGLASYLRIEPSSGVIEVGHIHFSPAMQRTAIATETMYLMMQRVFTGLGYRRYEWKCDSLNSPSRRAAERLGFEFEGIFRQATHYKGRNRDTAWFAIIDSDWPALQQRFMHWLDRENFDSLGNQRQRLEDC